MTVNVKKLEHTGKTNTWNIATLRIRDGEPAVVQGSAHAAMTH